MKTHLIVIVLMIVSIHAQSQKLKKSAGYFQTPGKVGIIVKTFPYSESYRSNSLGAIGGAIGGALDAVTSSRRPKTKYDSALALLQPRLDPLDTVRQVYQDIYTKKGKSVVMLDESLESASFPAFHAPAADKKYSELDIRGLKDKYQVDEVLIVLVEYGVYSIYKYGMEMNQMGRCVINTELIHTNDNSLVFSNKQLAYSRFHGEWNTPPDYQVLSTGVRDAIKESLGHEQKNYQKLGM